MKSIESRAVLNTTFHAVGRGGEVGLLTWSCLYWNYSEELLGGKWMQQKTSDVTDMTFFADSSKFEICHFHSMACYLIVGGGGRRASETWVFPFLSDISVSTAVTRILKELAVDVESLHSDVTSKDIRVGSANDIINAEGNKLRKLLPDTRDVC